LFPGKRPAFQGTDDQVDEKQEHEQKKPDGVEEIEELLGLEKGCQTGRQPAGEFLGGLLLGDEGASNGQHRNENKEGNRQVKQRKK